MFKVTNISGQVIGIVVETRPGVFEQSNLFPNDTMEVFRCFDQIFQLCDPVKNILKVEEAE